ncbi:unnamed protein product [Auanema sp. JU1783]|nr:unnamed protein product [Auanema sp. JU1783]
MDEYHIGCQSVEYQSHNGRYSTQDIYQIKNEMNNLWFLILLLTLQSSVYSSNSWKKRRRRDGTEKDQDAYGRILYPKRPHHHRSEHPELRNPPLPDEDGISEFVRREYSDNVYKKVRTYSKLWARSL